MPRGGRRVGAGRKPALQPSGIVLGMNGQRRQASTPTAPAVSGDEREALLQAPDDLPELARHCWLTYAGHAVAERTLTPATAAGFRQCCQQWAYVAEIDARIQHLGAATQDAQPYLMQYIRLSQRLDASLARFKLTAFGKPVTTDKPKPAANPWAQVAAP